jgi:hypothetical protein
VIISRRQDSCGHGQPVGADVDLAHRDVNFPWGKRGLIGTRSNLERVVDSIDCLGRKATVGKGFSSVLIRRELHKVAPASSPAVPRASSPSARRAGPPPDSRRDGGATCRRARKLGHYLDFHLMCRCVRPEHLVDQGCRSEIQRCSGEEVRRVRAAILRWSAVDSSSRSGSLPGRE